MYQIVYHNFWAAYKIEIINTKKSQGIISTECNGKVGGEKNLIKFFLPRP